MLLTRLHVHNFGPLRGLHEIDVRTLDQSRPVIIFGGKNGSGKTTLLEAVQLALYGRRALRSRPSLVEYHQYLRKKIHRGTTDSPSMGNAAVGIEFEHGHAGQRTVYRVERAWTIRGSARRVVEELTVLRDGQSMGELDRDHWQDFIDSLIPPPLAGLFFFDGERIQALAESADDDPEVGSAIKALLGLDVVEQLEADLSIYMGRQAPRGNGEPASRLTAVTAGQEQLSQREARIRQDLAQVRQRIDHQQVVIRRAENELTRAGGGFAKQRASLEQESRQLAIQRVEAEEGLRTLCAGLLPFALAPALCAHVIETLERERTIELEAAARVSQRRAMSLIEEALTSPTFWTLNGTKKQAALSGALNDAIRGLLHSRFLELTRGALGLREGAPDEQKTVAHGLAPADVARVTALLQQAVRDVGPTASRLSARLRSLNARHRQVEGDLHRAPEDGVVRPLFEGLAAHHAELAALERQAVALEADLKELQLLEQQAQRERRELEEKLACQDEASRRLQLTARVQQALRKFHAELTSARLEELERTVVHCFAQLARKRELVARVAIDPDTLHVALFSGDGLSVPKSHLSAGEKQIYAIAFLWALAQVSGRKLPIIIDTPLARLDRDHRRNLAERYFPFAAEQVLILSTDSEIDKDLIRHLAPAVSRRYRLEYDAGERSSKVTSGYFWDASVETLADGAGQTAQPGA
jgi:DNA sulfur modification protein DndD